MRFLRDIVFALAIVVLMAVAAFVALVHFEIWNAR